jgi:hypothetical protein
LHDACFMYAITSWCFPTLKSKKFKMAEDLKIGKEVGIWKLST